MGEGGAKVAAEGSAPAAKVTAPTLTAMVVGSIAGAGLGTVALALDWISL